MSLKTWAVMNTAERRATVSAMWKMGGRFAQALSEAFAVADERNAQRLADAFPEFVERYSAMSKPPVEVGHG